jgi:hypothetical protein
MKAEDEREFQWTLANVRGRVIHRAIEGLIMSGYRRTALELAESSIVELSREDQDSWGPAQFLRELSDSDRHDLTRSVNDILIKFRTDWPAIQDSWTPRVESSTKVAFGKVLLHGKCDLALGLPHPTQSRVFLVDFKTGQERAEHQEDMRFYALVETLRTSVPPYRAATYYLDFGEYVCEDINEDLLQLQLRRVVEGAHKIAHLALGETPRYTPGRTCGYCSANASCVEGQTWLSQQELLL